MRFKSLAVAVTTALIVLIGSPAVQAQTGCPTSGSGVTCFGGQYFCAATGMCKVPVESCPENQVLSCGACGCACPAGTTVCGDGTSVNYQTCIINRSCPSGMTWDVCNDTCVTPFVLLTPGAPQAGNPRVNGTMSLSGNLWAGDDVYVSDGKAIRVDGAGVTSLYLGNWDAAAGGFSMSVDGDLYSASVNTNELCLSGDCLSSWPGVSDYTSWFVDATGDVMTGTLRLTAPTSLVTSGRIGIGTATPTQALDVFGTAKMTGLQLPTGAAAGKVLISDASGNGTWQNPSVAASGSLNRIAKFTGASSLGDSIIFDNGNLVGIGTTAPSNGKLHVVSSGGTGIYGNGQTGVFGSGTTFGLYGSSSSFGILGTGNVGVRGEGSTYGMFGVTANTSGTAIYGINVATTGSGIGVNADTQNSGYALYANAPYGTAVAGYGATGLSVTSSAYPNYINGPQNNSVSSPALILNENGGSQVGLDFRNGNVQNAHIRADNSGNLVLSGTNAIYLGYPDLGVTNDINFRNGGMYLNGTGLGIGTTGPAYKLDVVGVIRSADYGGAGSVNVMIGDDAFFSDIDQWGVIGLNGVGDNNVAGLRLGNGGPVIFGANGNLGVGTTSPDAKLRVWGGRIAVTGSNYNGTMSLETFNGHGYISLDGASQPIFIASVSGNIAIGTSIISGYKLYVNGSTFSTGGYGSSDARLKKNVETIGGALDKVTQLRGVTFDWRKEQYPERNLDDGRQIGLIAQETEEVVPEIVRTDLQGFKAVSYEKLAALLVEAVKELNDKVSHRGDGEVRKACTLGADCRCDDGWYVVGIGGQETPKEIICHQL